jgi:phosphoglycolate phosphatase-like HAD superfamily hydrolase
MKSVSGKYRGRATSQASASFPATIISRRGLIASLAALAVTFGLLLPTAASAQSDPLPSWNDGPAKQAIIDFVTRVTKEGGPNYVEPAERIATFDNDGTLWLEQPQYTQFVFALDRVKALAPQHPEWKTTQPFQAVLEGDEKTLEAAGEKGLVDIVAATHAGMTTDQFNKIVADWLATTKDKRFKRVYTELVYQPMLELLTYLRANGFKTFIVSGGGQEFLRVFADKTYGVPPEQVVGSTGATEFQMLDASPVLMKMPKVDFVDDGPGKPVGINKFIGRRPIFAFGNSDGDQQMLEWTAAGEGTHFMGLVHHTDAEREYAYDRQSKIGKLDKALDEAIAKGWTVVDMKNDWKTIFPVD